MLRKFLSISGKQGLFKLVNQGKNMLIVESLTTGKRGPAYAHDKIVSLGDISIYTTEGDVALAEVFEKIKEANGGKAVDLKAIGNDDKIREYFKTILPDFDEDRVYTTDIKKVFAWYNQLIENGVDKFKAEEKEEAAADEAEN
ncbi:MAG: DUF5606 domain-containing protein [Muribaculaceae bacterium]|nr:DUF5606 domain-containing protein [Muribaculaceae bacterium]